MMSIRIRIDTLVEDRVGASGLEVEHGLSLLVRAFGRRWLFDTGQSEVVVRNARALGQNLQALDGVVVSHGHHDHTGGLAAVLTERGPTAR